MASPILPDEPTRTEWEQWLADNCKVDGLVEENLMHSAEPQGACASCQWWRSRNLHKDLMVLENGDVFVGGGLTGECMRFPPTVTTADEHVANYPTTTSDMTCGEWQARTWDGERTALTRMVDSFTAFVRRDDGETARMQRDGSVVKLKQLHRPQ